MRSKILMPKWRFKRVRGLFVFRDLPEVHQALQTLTNHPNELVRDALQSTLQPAHSTTPPRAHLHSPDTLKKPDGMWRRPSKCCAAYPTSRFT
ncbi:MAG: hypothetical protein KatS3mg017_0560 [Fimbriimonadales bacterium]|nr:MAG: hypothetical protein KatS3mg017_0560 [Fimbriimonadales bacterium]